MGSRDHKLSTASLRVKLIWLVTLPLVLQIILLGRLAWLQSEAEATLHDAYRYTKVLKTLVELDADTFRLLEMFYATKLNSQNALDVMHAVNTAVGDLNKPIAELKLLADKDADARELLAQCRRLKANILDAVKQLSTQVISRPGEEEHHRVMEHLMQVSREATALVPRLERIVEESASQRYSRTTNLKSEERTLIVIGGLIDGCFAIVLAVFVSQNISLRLFRLKRNLKNFANNKSLEEAPKSGDEIGSLETELFEMAHAIRALERREKTLVNGSPDPIVFLDTNLCVIFANTSAQREFARLGRELKGASFLEFIDEASKQPLKSYLESVRNDVAGGGIQITLNSDSQKVFSVTSAWNTFDSGSWLCILHDLSERFRAEQMRAEIVDMFTHDLKSPLTSIKLTTQLLAETVDEAAKVRVSRVEANAERMSALINDLLDLHRAQSGELVFRSYAVDPVGLIDEAIEVLQDTAQSLGVTLIPEIETKAQVYADRSAALRVLVNLMSNAIKFSPSGQSVAIKVTECGGDRIRFAIVDRGPGIKPEELESIFLRFRQASTVPKASIPELGSGLGLSICKVFVEKQNGEIGVTSCVGEGSTFWFELPTANRNDVSQDDPAVDAGRDA